MELAKETAQKIMTTTGAKAGAFGLNVLAIEFSQLAKASASIIYSKFKRYKHKKSNPNSVTEKNS